VERSDWLLGWAVLWLFGGTQAECVVEGGASLWSDLMQRAWGYIRKTWVSVLVLLLSSCVTLVKGCSFSFLPFRAVVRTQHQTYTTYITCCSCDRCSGNATSLPILFLYLHSCPSNDAWNSLLCSEIFPIGMCFPPMALWGLLSSPSFWLLTSIWH